MSEPDRLLHLAAAVSSIITRSGPERLARTNHETARARGIAPHAHFRFEHCPDPECCRARRREPGDEG